MACDVCNVVVSACFLFIFVFLSCCSWEILHQKAEARDHYDLISSMVVGRATASFFGGEPLAINVNRFNPWCYNFRQLYTCVQSWLKNLLYIKKLVQNLATKIYSEVQGLWIWYSGSGFGLTKSVDNHQNCKLLRSFVLTECFPFFPSLGACWKYSLTTEPIRNMLKWYKQEVDWSCETGTNQIVVHLRGGDDFISHDGNGQFLGISFLCCVLVLLVLTSCTRRLRSGVIVTWTLQWL